MKKTIFDRIVSEEEYLNKKSSLNDYILQTELDYNKSLMNLSGGALALSVTVVQIFLPNKINYPELLYLAWFLLSLSTILCLLFFKISLQEQKVEIEKVEYLYNTKPPKRIDDFREHHQKEALRNDFIKRSLIEKIQAKTKRFLGSLRKGILNYFSNIVSILFIGGIFSLMLFTYFNLGA